MTNIKELLKKAVKIYDKYAQRYAQYNYHKLLQFQLNKFITLLPGKKVLDVGCGPGRDVEYFKDEGLDIIGVDISKGMVEEAKKRVDAQIKKMDLLKLKFKKNNFDGVWCVMTLNLIPKEDINLAITQMNNVLVLNGIVFISVKEGQGVQVKQDKRYDNETKVLVLYKLGELEQTLKDNGFEIINSTITKSSHTNFVEIFAKKI